MQLKRIASSSPTPNGYRLATFREIEDKMDKLNAQGLLSESRTTRVLDGIVCGRADLPVTEKLLTDRLPKHMLVIGQPNDDVSGNNPALFRKNLYSGITLDDKRRKKALYVASKAEDIEVIYWLRHSSNPSQLNNLREWFDKTREWFGRPKSSKLCSPDSCLVRKMLLSDCPGEKETQDFYAVGKMLLCDHPGEKEMAGALLYTLQCKKSVEYAISVAEIVLDACYQQRQMGRVHKLIQTIAKTKIDPQGDAMHTALLTKLLSESPNPREYSTDIIKQWFPKLLSEACRRRYQTLVHELYVIHEVDLAATNETIDLDSKTQNGKTPLHAAAAYGHVEIVKMLLSQLSLKDMDNQGRTPLHLAAREGNVEMVTCLLNSGSDPLEERDMSGRTVLHYAVTCKKGPETAKQLVDVLMAHYKSDEKMAFLLLCVSASGIGTAKETKDINPDLKKYIKAIRKKFQENINAKELNLLEEAAVKGNPRLAWEFLNRTGQTDKIDRIPQNMMQHIEKYMEQGIDRPTYTDTLGRNALAECVAEHFLNSHIKSPITVCISGGSGMGKTSLLYQIKAYLQITYSQLAFPYLWKYEKFSGEKISVSAKGKRMLRKIEKGVMKLMETKKDIGYGFSKEKPLVQFLSTYRPEYEAVYKSLACMDFAQLLKNKDEDSGYRYQGQNMGAAPRVLTVDFNAGMYRGNYEAWAGLAVKISETIEDSMTWAQRLSTRWRNARRVNNTNFFVKFILPGFLLAFLAGWVGWAAWLLLDRTNNKSLNDLKYGSTTATIIAIVWAVVGQSASIFKSVSTKMNEYFKVSDYSDKLSYQEQVVSDIKFLKGEIGRSPLLAFSLFTGEKLNNWFGLWRDNIKDTSNPIYRSERRKKWFQLWEDDIKDTSIPKYGSAPEGKLQIIAFVDDLDHCEDEAVLKVMWSINLVFRECDINFILAVDKTTIQQAFISSASSQGEDAVDDFISKIIQLPVNLPDPADDEWEAFVQEELGLKFDAEKNYEVVETDASSSAKDKGSLTDSHHKHADGRDMYGYEGCIPYSYRQTKGKSQDVEGGSIQSENGISSFFQKILSWVQWLLCIFYFVACNVRNESDKIYVNKSDLRKSDVLSTRMLEVRGSLMLAYTEVEIQTFDKLREFAAGKQRFPREWKCFIKYHRFARNVILKKARKLKIVFPDPWQAEFVAWTYVCVRWKREMNVLIKQWHKLIENTPAKDEKSSSNIASLKKVVGKYKAQRWPEIDEKDCKKLTEALNKIQSIPQNWAEGFKEYEIKCGVKAEEIEFNYKTTQSIIDAEEKERERWDELYKCLKKVQDVPLRSLHIFQEYRFHCDANNLRIPFPIVAKRGT